MFKKLNKKGFTLAELLIVVAIIAVLVAISIPIFTTQLEKSKEAVDAANIRAAYAEVIADAITNDTAAHSKTVTLKQAKANWQNKFEFPANLTEATEAAQPTGEVGQTVTITYTPSATSGSVADTCSINLKLSVPTT